MPLVSVIIPNYNYAQFLPERIYSVLNQTFRDFEVILLDDCSTDNSASVLKQYAQQDKRISNVVINTTNSGSPFCQWEKGIQLAKGKYIWIAEADDSAEPTFLSSLISQMEQHPKAILAQTASILVTPEGQRINRDYDHWKRLKIQENSIDYIEGKQFIRKYLYTHNQLYNASGILFRKDAILSSDLQSFAIPGSGDWLFFATLISRGYVLRINQRLNHFRQHNNSVTHQIGTTALFREVDIIRQIENLFNATHCDKFFRRLKLFRHARRLGADRSCLTQLFRYVVQPASQPAGQS